MLVAVRANRAEWIAPGVAAAVLMAAASAAMKHRLSKVPAAARSALRRGRLFSDGAMSPSAMAGLISLAVLQEIVNVVETYAVLAWLGAGPTLESAIALEGLNRLANAPAQLIPGKLGVLELAGSAFAGILQLGSANGLTLVLARRVRSLAWSGVGILLLTTSASLVRADLNNPAVV